MASRLALVVLALGAAACATVTGLGDYEITPDGPPQPDGGAAVAMGGITISTTTLAFPGGRCGETKTLPMNIANGRDTAVSLAVTLPPGVTIEGNGGSIPAHGALALQVSATVGGTGTIQLRAGDVSFDVTYTASFTGAHVTADPASLDFGEIRHSTASAPQKLTFTNDGDEDVSVTGLDGTKDFALAAPVKVPAHGTGEASFTMTSAPAGDPITASTTATLDKPVCNGAPVLSLKGQRTASDVTVSATELGDVACNSPVAKTLTLTNYSTSVPAHYVIVGTTGLTIGPNPGDIVPATSDGPGTVVVTLSPPPTIGDYKADITITDDATPPTPARTVSVHLRVAGAMLTSDNAELLVTPGTTGSKPLKNTGNIPVCLHYVNEDSGSGGDPQGAGVTLEPDEKLDPNVDGDIKVTLAATYAKSRTHIRATPIACPGVNAAAPVCPAGDVHFVVKIDPTH